MIGQKELEILRAALVERCEGEIDLDGVRSARVVEFQRPKPLSRLTAVQRWRLLVSDGQTLYVTKLGRPSASDMPPDSDVQMSAKPARTTAEQSLTAPALAVGLKLTVTDIKAMTAFYEEVLGLRPGRHSHRFVSFGALSLISAEAAIELSEGAVAGSQAALRHRIQVQVVNLEAVFGRVQDSGGKILQPIREMPWRERVFHCVDPEGNLVEVTERP
jgi:predicted enzyme related to lactoylglutathione lyase